MAETTELKLCILWEGELREAARLMHQAFNSELSEKDRDKAASRAFSAAAAALWGLTDDHACCLVGSDEIRKSRLGAMKRNADPTTAVQEKP